MGNIYRWMVVCSIFLLSQGANLHLAYSQSSDTTLKLLQELESLEGDTGQSKNPGSLSIKSTLEKPLEKLLLPKSYRDEKKGLRKLSANPSLSKMVAPRQVAKMPSQKKGRMIFAKKQYAPSPETLWQNRRDSEFHWNRGLDYWANDDYKSAIEHFKRAMRNQPQNPHGHWNLSTLYNRIGDGVMAIYHMNIAHKIYLHDHNRKEIARAKNKLNNLIKKYGYKKNNMRGQK